VAAEALVAAASDLCTPVLKMHAAGLRHHLTTNAAKQCQQVSWANLLMCNLAMQGPGIPLQVIDRLLYSCWQVQCLRNPKASQPWRLSYLLRQHSCLCQYNLFS